MVEPRAVKLKPAERRYPRIRVEGTGGQRIALQHVNRLVAHVEYDGALRVGPVFGDDAEGELLGIAGCHLVAEGLDFYLDGLGGGGRRYRYPAGIALAVADAVKPDVERGFPAWQDDADGVNALFRGDPPLFHNPSFLVGKGKQHVRVGYVAPQEEGGFSPRGGNDVILRHPQRHVNRAYGGVRTVKCHFEILYRIGCCGIDGRERDFVAPRGERLQQFSNRAGRGNAGYRLEA